MRTILWMIYFWVYLIAVLPIGCHIRHLRKSGKDEKAQALLTSTIQKWARRLLWAAGVTVHISGEENLPKVPVLFASNHQGYFDIPTLITSLGGYQHPIVAKKEIGKIPLIRNWMKAFHCIFMDRKDPRQSLRCLQEAQRLMEEGNSVIIFPEGTRSRSDTLGEFKTGAFKPALKGGFPIVPISIDGSWHAMEQNHMWIHPAQIYFTILPPIETADLTREQAAKIGERVREQIALGRLQTRKAFCPETDQTPAER